MPGLMKLVPPALACGPLGRELACAGRAERRGVGNVMFGRIFLLLLLLPELMPAPPEFREGFAGALFAVVFVNFELGNELILASLLVGLLNLIACLIPNSNTGACSDFGRMDGCINKLSVGK